MSGIPAWVLDPTTIPYDPTGLPPEPRYQCVVCGTICSIRQGKAHECDPAFLGRIGPRRLKKAIHRHGSRFMIMPQREGPRGTKSSGHTGRPCVPFASYKQWSTVVRPRQGGRHSRRGRFTYLDWPRYQTIYARTHSPRWRDFRHVGPLRKHAQTYSEVNPWSNVGVLVGALMALMVLTRLQLLFPFRGLAGGSTINISGIARSDYVIEYDGTNVNVLNQTTDLATPAIVGPASGPWQAAWNACVAQFAARTNRGGTLSYIGLNSAAMTIPVTGYLNTTHGMTIWGPGFGKRNQGGGHPDAGTVLQCTGTAAQWSSGGSATNAALGPGNYSVVLDCHGDGVVGPSPTSNRENLYVQNVSIDCNGLADCAFLGRGSGTGNSCPLMSCIARNWRVTGFMIGAYGDTGASANFPLINCEASHSNGKAGIATTAASYDNTTGQVTLTMASDPRGSYAAGDPITVTDVGLPPAGGYDGHWVVAAATATQLFYNIPTGLALGTGSNGNVNSERSGVTVLTGDFHVGPACDFTVPQAKACAIYCESGFGIFAPDNHMGSGSATPPFGNFVLRSAAGIVVVENYCDNIVSTVGGMFMQPIPAPTAKTWQGGAVALPQATITLNNTTNLPTAGAVLITSTSNLLQVVSYTGVAGATLTGCTGGSGTMANGNAVVLVGTVGQGGSLIRVDIAHTHFNINAATPHVLIDNFHTGSMSGIVIEDSESGGFSPAGTFVQLSNNNGAKATPGVSIWSNNLYRVTNIYDAAVVSAATTNTDGAAAAIPRATINVASTADFMSNGQILVTSVAAGTQAVRYTGITATSFTGCSGGTGTTNNGGAVSQFGKDPDIPTWGNSCRQTGGAGTSGSDYGVTAITAATAGITNTETLVVSMALPGGGVIKGATFRIRGHGVITSSAANNVTLNLKAGTLGTTGDTSITTIVSVATTTAAGQGFDFDAVLTVRKVGNAGKIVGNGTMDGNSVGPQPFTNVTTKSNLTGAGLTLDFTAAWFLDLTFVAAAATTTITIHEAAVERLV